MTLIVFYLTSSKLTRWRSELKARLEAGHMAGGQRGAAQVLANSALGGCLAVATAWLRADGGPGSPAAAQLTAWAFVAFYACCCADTWSSELGIASGCPPRLITTGSVVPPGTNGGVSSLGTAAAAAGGLLMGACYVAAAGLSAALAAGAGNNSAASGPGACQTGAAADWRLVPLAVAAGVGGSLLDSLLGATLQFSGVDERSGKVVSGMPAAGTPAAAAVRHISGRDVLSNTGVNVAASLATAALAATAASRLLPPC